MRGITTDVTKIISPHNPSNQPDSDNILSTSGLDDAIKVVLTSDSSSCIHVYFRNLYLADCPDYHRAMTTLTALTNPALLSISRPQTGRWRGYVLYSIHAGIRGTGEELWSAQVRDNPKSIELANVALFDWIKENSRVTVIVPSEEENEEDE